MYRSEPNCNDTYLWIIVSWLRCIFFPAAEANVNIILKWITLYVFHIIVRNREYLVFVIMEWSSLVSNVTRNVMSHFINLPRMTVCSSPNIETFIRELNRTEQIEGRQFKLGMYVLGRLLVSGGLYLGGEPGYTWCY